MNHYTPSPCPDHGTPQITNRGTNPKYPSIFTGAMMDMVHEVKTIKRQAPTLLKEYVEGNVEMMHDKIVNPLSNAEIDSIPNRSKIPEGKIVPGSGHWIPPVLPDIHVIVRTS